jgi:small subunit ribosomal protein S6
MLNHYEAAMLLKPGLSDKDVEKFIAEMRELLGAKEAVEIDEGRVERRNLAYPVKKNTEGYYVFIQFDAPPTLPDAMKLELKHREELLRLAFIRRPSPAELAAQAEAAARPETPAPAAPAPEDEPEAAPETEEPAAEPVEEPEAAPEEERDDG